jgi:transcriptional regulator with XRE-family HTH domain
VPRPAKFTNPLRAVREAANKTQPEFARICGVSKSYIQAVELGKRTLNDNVCYAIALRFGVNIKTLKKKRGLPTPLLASKLPQLNRREQLRRQIELWQQVFPAIEEGMEPKTTIVKLRIFAEAAGRWKKKLAMLSLLNRWMENQITDFNLRAAVMRVAEEHKFNWQPFENELVWATLTCAQPRLRNMRLRHVCPQSNASLIKKNAAAGKR